MTHKDFNIVTSTRIAPTFSVAGHEFKCLADPPAGVLADLIISTDGDSVGKQAASIVGVIVGCLPDPQAEEFTSLLYDKDTVVPIETLAEIAAWLIEEYGTPRPTTPSSGSPSGLSETPATSEDGAASPESTPEPSEPST